MNVALVGNQNSGKSSLFNALCGTKQKVGNWPGVTIDKLEGKIKKTEWHLIDLPGTYSLNPYTAEEEITVNYLKNNKLDVIINVIDATNLNRSLYLTTQLLDLNIPLIIVLNMADLLENRGIKIEIPKLEKALNAKVFLISASKNKGIEKLKEYLKNNEFSQTHNYVQFDKTLEDKLKNKNRFEELKKLSKTNLMINNTDINDYIVQKRYHFIDEVLSIVLSKTSKKNISEKLDKIFLNKYLGIPIFIIIMGLIYVLSIKIGNGILGGVVDSGLNSFSEFIRLKLEDLSISPWLISLISDGIIQGVSSVLTFLPSLAILFLCINILESSGYMSRISLLLDRLFYKLGLNGKSLIPFIVGSGCAVPGITAARTIENIKEKEKTMALTSFIPCSAKLPLIILFATNFFPKYQLIVAVGLYFCAFLIIILLSLITQKISKLKSSSNFISELPEYKAPDFKYIFSDTLLKVKDFIVRAGTVILTCSIIVWCLSHLTFSFEYVEDISSSILAHIGKAISFIFVPMLKVNSWEATVSIMQGIIAKEQVVASMEILANLNHDASLFTGTFSFFTPLTAFSFCVFNLFSCPCISTIITLKKELKNTKKVAFIVLLQTLFAYVLASSITMIGSLFS